MSRLRGFAPIVGSAPRLLILGSMPSVASLERHEYYGKAQNAFWRIMGALFDAGPDLDYDTRVLRLADAGVAVWDVIASCRRQGSLDSAIDLATVEVNPVPALLQQHAGIDRIFFNGRTAEQIYRRRLAGDVRRVRPEILYCTLPSTSPAMATLDFAGKLERWRVLLDPASATG